MAIITGKKPSQLDSPSVPFKVSDIFVGELSNGQVAKTPLPSGLHGNIAYVAPPNSAASMHSNGDDATAKVGNASLPFSTLQGAADALASVLNNNNLRTIKVLNGSFAEDVTLSGGISIVVEEGATIRGTITTSGNSCVIVNGAMIVDGAPAVVMNGSGMINGNFVTDNTPSSIVLNNDNITVSNAIIETRNGTSYFSGTAEEVVVLNTFANIVGGHGNIPQRVQGVTESDKVKAV